uniref:Uncharacterized protein n=1 Tax=Anopheles coluzzii TaxID=1518534 RepID=A0A6E8W1P5_ANOCL
MRPYYICMIALVGTWWVTAFIRFDKRVYPIVTYYDIKGNGKYVNAWIDVLGEHVTNKTYMVLSFGVPGLGGLGNNVLFTRNIDGCEFLRRPTSDRFVKIIYDEIKQHSKIPRCPYKLGDSIVMNFTPHAMTMPSLIPESECYFEMKSFTKANTELVFETRWQGTLIMHESTRKGIETGSG